MRLEGLQYAGSQRPVVHPVVRAECDGHVGFGGGYGAGADEGALLGGADGQDGGLEGGEGCLRRAGEDGSLEGGGGVDRVRG